MIWWKKICGLQEDPDPVSECLSRISLVIYDVTDNKRRYKIHKALKSFGVPVQKSAFECRLDNSMHEKMIRKLIRLIKQDEDLLRVYRLNNNFHVQCWGVVGNLEPFEGYWIVKNS